MITAFLRVFGSALALDGSVHDFAYGKAKGVYQYLEREDVLSLASLRVPIAYRGLGHAKAAMVAFLRLADATGKPVKLVASPLDKKTKLADLVRFYEGFGFERTGERGNYAGDPVMVRPTI